MHTRCFLLLFHFSAIRDLLAPKGSEDSSAPLKAREVAAAAAGSSSGSAKSSGGSDVSIEVPGLVSVVVENQSEVLELLRRGSAGRNVRKTDMNDSSSRSHLVLTVYVHCSTSTVNASGTHVKQISSKFHMIDLAGSERVGRSGVTGEALKEANSINTSLSALSNVIYARGRKESHVPFRDSTLTFLLKDSLSGNSKTLMIVQISEAITNSSETLCSLKFAVRVRAVELGKAAVNSSSSSSSGNNISSLPLTSGIPSSQSAQSLKKSGSSHGFSMPVSQLSMSQAKKKGGEQ